MRFFFWFLKLLSARNTRHLAVSHPIIYCYSLDSPSASSHHGFTHSPGREKSDSLLGAILTTKCNQGPKITCYDLSLPSHIPISIIHSAVVTLLSWSKTAQLCPSLVVFSTVRSVWVFTRIVCTFCTSLFLYPKFFFQGNGANGTFTQMTPWTITMRTYRWGKLFILFSLFLSAEQLKGCM